MFLVAERIVGQVDLLLLCLPGQALLPEFVAKAVMPVITSALVPQSVMPDMLWGEKPPQPLPPQCLPVVAN
ncbi:hypothetical protein [Thalassomonas sp. RHCl1]|uniref:hypothetical protein n=1 Tax=Thalassomonas sp. RHCl1 TaxID=2995320 RepID=UPI00248C90EB|nr:hypothetical protein [Thalassomonas sp. RHCl1]